MASSKALPVGAGTERTIRPLPPLGLASAGRIHICAGVHVDDQRIADGAGHQVPDLSLIRAHEDPLPLHAGEDNLKVAVRSGVGVRIER